MKKKLRRKVFFLFLLVSFIWSQSVIGMHQNYGFFKDELFYSLSTYEELIGVGAIEYKRKTKKGKNKVVAIVILDGPAEVSYPLNRSPNVRYAKHRKVLLDLAHQEDIRYAYLAPNLEAKSSSTSNVLNFYEFSYLQKLNEQQMQCKMSQIKFKDWCNEEDDAMRILLICKDHYNVARDFLLSLKFERQCALPYLNSKKTALKEEYAELCFLLKLVPVRPFQLKEFLLYLNDCCGMCTKKIKSQDDKIRCQGKCECVGYCSKKCLEEAYENGHKSYCLAKKGEIENQEEKDVCLIQ